MLGFMWVVLEDAAASWLNAVLDRGTVRASMWGFRVQLAWLHGR